jgi:hypothetical protein
MRFAPVNGTVCDLIVTNPVGACVAMSIWIGGNEHVDAKV